MSLPAPFPGLVVRYSHVWHSEPRRRPRRIDHARSLPITHVEPKAKELAIEIPAVVKQHLGLDAERSWIVVDKANRFI